MITGLISSLTIVIVDVLLKIVRDEGQDQVEQSPAINASAINAPVINAPIAMWDFALKVSNLITLKINF